MKHTYCVSMLVGTSLEMLPVRSHTQLESVIIVMNFVLKCVFSPHLLSSQYICNSSNARYEAKLRMVKHYKLGIWLEAVVGLVS